MKSLALALVVATVATAAQAAAPQPAKPIDADRFYQGTWHEIGRRPMWITDGCVAGTTAYAPGPDGKVMVRDACRKGDPSGKEKAISGKGTILDPGTNAKLRVRYNLLISRDYWVLDRDEAYAWFISASPDFKDLYIFTRDPSLTDAKRDALIERARQLGYDAGKLEFPVQPAK